MTNFKIKEPVVRVIEAGLNIASDITTLSCPSASL